jgi:hypothetical protein
MSNKCELFKPQSSIEFVHELTNLAERLAARNYVIAELQISYCFFGSWKIEVWKNDEAVRFFYDDRDRDLIVKSSPNREPLSAPNGWRQEHIQSFDGRQKVYPLKFVEDYLAKRFAS